MKNGEIQIAIVQKYKQSTVVQSKRCQLFNHNIFPSEIQRQLNDFFFLIREWLNFYFFDFALIFLSLFIFRTRR